MYPKRNKYNAQKCGGYDSKLEASVGDKLALLEIAGEVSFVERQKNVFLTEARIKYRIDYKIFHNVLGVDVYVEAKGFMGDRWKIATKLWPYYGPSYLVVVSGSFKSPRITDVITPQQMPLAPELLWRLC